MNHTGMQVERALWRENGLAPPMPGTDAEKHWAEVDKAVPFTKVCDICHGAFKAQVVELACAAVGWVEIQFYHLRVSGIIAGPVLGNSTWQPHLQGIDAIMQSSMQ